MKAIGTRRKETAMRSLVAVAAVVAAAVVGSIVWGARPAVIAVEATPTSTGNHPVVGAWWTANDALGPGVETAYAVFHADGTYLEVDPNIGVGVGVWRATDEHSAELTYVFQDIDPEPATTAPGTVTVRQSVEVGNHTLFLGEVVNAAFLKPEDTEVLRMEDTRMNYGG